MKKITIIHQRGRDEMYKLWHKATANEFIYMHSTGGSIVFKDRVYPIKKGILCFIREGTVHYTMPNDANEYERSKLFYKNTEQEKYIDKMFTNKCESLGTVVFAQIPPKMQPEFESVLNLIGNANVLKSEQDIFLIACFFRFSPFCNPLK